MYQSARQWKSAAPSIRVVQQHLVDIEPARFETVGGPGHVEPPFAVRHRVGGANHILLPGFQTPYPVPEGKCIVLAQALHIAHLETARL